MLLFVVQHRWLCFVITWILDHHFYNANIFFSIQKCFILAWTTTKHALVVLSYYIGYLIKMPTFSHFFSLSLFTYSTAFHNCIDDHVIFIQIEKFAETKLNRSACCRYGCIFSSSCSLSRYADSVAWQVAYFPYPTIHAMILLCRIFYHHIIPHRQICIWNA